VVYQFIPHLIGSCGALAIAAIMILTYNLLVRSFCDLYAFKRHEAWKKEIFRAWRR